jgi:GTPase SAR1 family protein
VNEFELEIFEQTSDYAEFRLSNGDGLQTRGLDRKAIENLIEVVEQAYREDSVAQRVFGSTQLRDLGEKLFHFLDGDERWFDQALADPRGTVLRISAEQRLRHLPWELVARDGAYLAVSEHTPLLTIRTASPIVNVGGAAKPHNRPLRVLFMATSPEGVEPVLSYEAEEAGILAATADTGTELVVEESGTLDGLRFTAESYGGGYFDVLHVSGHATVHEGQPKFVVENELGGPVLATADELARAMAGQWPRMVFVSGCLTGNAPDRGTIPSMSEDLVKAGAPLVLGWALPVGDAAASEFASQLYRALAAGQDVDRSVVAARQRLYAGQSRNWHLLRVYADKSPLTSIVTPRNALGREPIQVRHAADEFLDPQTQISRVASRAGFVGRRRVIQRCLRTLKQPIGSEGAAEALVLHGMGGLGKSTLASRLLERMPTYQRVVWFGRVDVTKLRELTSKVTFESMDLQIEASKILDDVRADLAVRLRYLFSGPLRRIPCLFVFDDFEQGNLEERDGGYVLSGEMAQILPALLKAIRETNSASRVVITSRYRFPAPVGPTIRVESLETLSDIEQTKKIANLPNLRPESVTTPAPIRDRAIEAASGNPRLLDWLDKIVADPTLDVDGLLAAIENEADRFRKENIFAEKLLAAQPKELQRMLAKANVIELPVPAAAVHAIHDHPEVGSHIRRAVALGLLEEGIDPETGDHRYFVSNVLRPLIRPLLTDDEYREACAAAARSLYQVWVLEGPAATGRDMPS